MIWLPNCGFVDFSTVRISSFVFSFMIITNECSMASHPASGLSTAYEASAYKSQRTPALLWSSSSQFPLLPLLQVVYRYFCLS